MINFIKKYLPPEFKQNLMEFNRINKIIIEELNNPQFLPTKNRMKITNL